tara:strand:+ start:568 stop:1479 length:912 start_codon:yes stop_codon:yes gene_type:complete
LFKYNILDISLINFNNYNLFNLLLIIFLIFLTIFFTSLRLYFILRYFELKLSLRYVFSITYIGYFFNQCLPGGQGGDLFKAFYLIKKYPNFKKIKLISYLVLDRMIGLIALIIIFSISIYSLNIFFNDLISLGIILLLLNLIIVLFFIIFFKLEGFKIIIHKLLLSIYLKTVSELINKISNYFNDKAVSLKWVFLLIFISIITFIISIICIILLDDSEMLSVNKIIKIYFVSSVTFFSNSIPVSFNGLGIGEYVFSKLSNFLFSGNITHYANLFLIYRIIMIIVSLPGLILFIIFKNTRIESK